MLTSERSESCKITDLPSRSWSTGSPVWMAIIWYARDGSVSKDDFSSFRHPIPESGSAESMAEYQDLEKGVAPASPPRTSACFPPEEIDQLESIHAISIKRRFLFKEYFLCRVGERARKDLLILGSSFTCFFEKRNRLLLREREREILFIKMFLTLCFFNLFQF